MRKGLALCTVWLVFLSSLLASLPAGADPGQQYNGFDDDAYADLAVGVPGDDVPAAGAAIAADVSAGAVNILSGSASGVSASNEPRLHQGLATMSDDAEAADGFGDALAAGDFNGDGYIDLAIGVPTEDVQYNGSDQQSAGAVNVVYGSAGGLVPGNEPIWHQDVEDIPGTPEPYDWFGFSLAAGDFDGDGNADLAIGVPEESLGSNPTHTECGAVHVLYGKSGEGLTAEDNQLWTQQNLGLGYDANCDFYEFGRALAVGNFDGDAYDDLAVGVPGEDIPGADGAGAVNILYGSGSGLAATGSQRWDQDQPGVTDDSEESDRFGFALAAGDFDSDAYADLAVGVIWEDVEYGGTNQKDAGAVNVLYGSQNGLVGKDRPIWHQGWTGVYGSPEPEDKFGFTLAAGDLNGDGYVDLAIGVPFEDLKPGEILTDAGVVNILYGYPEGLTATGEPAVNHDATFPSVERFGIALAFGDANADTYADLAIGISFQDFGTTEDAGAVKVLKGSANGLTGESDPLWHQNSPGVDGSIQENDWFGSALTFGQQPRNLVARPTNVQASNGTYSDRVHITWDGVGADGYHIYVSDTPAGDKFPVGTATTTEYDDTDATPGVLLWYSVKAVIGGDLSAASDEDSGYRGFELLPPGTPPTAAFTIEPTTGPVSTVFTFDASACSDNEEPASALEVCWDWQNDGVCDTAWQTDKTTTHTFDSAGTYVIRLRVRDSGGLQSAATNKLTVSEGQISNRMYVPIVIKNQVEPR